MKKTVLFAAMGVIASAGVALADQDIGCGWGTMLWQGQEGVPQKVMGATTNGTLGSQTFGISSQTAGCHRTGIIRADARTTMFAGANMDRLSHDMAAGQGETLDTLALLLGIEDADKPAFFQMTKDNFAGIFSADRITAGQMLGNIAHVMATDPQLAKYVAS